MANGDGGVCCIGNDCQPTDPATCQQVNGVYHPKPPPGSGGCFITQVIREYLKDEHAHDLIVTLMVGGTYSQLIDAKEQILDKWKLGQTAVKLYREHGAEVLKLTQSDWELRRQLLLTFLKIAMFSRALLRYLRNETEDLHASGSYTLAMHKELYSAMYRLEACNASPGLIGAFQSILNGVEEFVDASIPEFIQKTGIKVASSGHGGATGRRGAGKKR